MRFRLPSTATVHLSVASGFLEVIEKAIPVFEARGRDDLERLAADRDMEPGEYFMEKARLDQIYLMWIPTAAGYSIFMFIYSIVEAQLDAIAERLGQSSGLELRLTDMAHKGIDRAGVYLTRALSVPVNKWPEWQFLKDMQKIRNIIVHRGGKWPSDKKQMEELRRKHKLELKKLDSIHDQIAIPIPLCREFVNKAREFFVRIDRPVTAAVASNAPSLRLG